MNTNQLMKCINLPKAAKSVVNENRISEMQYQEAKKVFYKDIKKFLEDWKTKEEKLQWGLEFYVKLASEVYEAYQTQGIPDEVFNQTFYDITIWCEECHRKYSVYGLEEMWWIGQSAKMNLFRLGRLQFEPFVLEEYMVGKERTIPAGTKVLNVHIPAGESLDYEACLKSFQKAEEFFKGKYDIYVCDSWLLSPKLQELLPEESNIIRFQKLFEITKVHYRFPQAEQRIFQDILENKEDYPENTTLQRKAKAYILSGNDIGIGTGFIEKIYN